MATIFECDYNDTDFPDRWGGGISWDPGPTRDNTSSPQTAGLSPLVGSLPSGVNMSAQSVGGEYSKISSVSSRRTGYKGHRIYLDDGQNNSTGGPGIQSTSLNNTELWMRWYMRTNVQWSVAGVGPDEPAYWKTWRVSGTGAVIVGLGYGDPTSVGGHKAWGIDINAPDGSPNDTNGGISWYTTQGDSLTGDEDWHCYEFHIKENSNAGTADGVFEFWYDGTQYQSVSNIYYESGASAWGFWETSNQNEVDGDGYYVDFTDIKIVNSGGPIGTLDAGGISSRSSTFRYFR